MPVADLPDRLVTPDAETLEGMGFDVGRLQSMQAYARSEEFRLQRIGLDTDRLRFYVWLIENGHNPEYSFGYPKRKHAARGTSDDC